MVVLDNPVEYPLKAELKDSASTLQIPRVNPESPHERSALDEFLASPRVKQELDTDKSPLLEAALLGNNDTDTEVHPNALDDPADVASHDLGRALPMRLQRQVRKWVEQHGAKAAPPFATNEHTHWPESRFVDRRGRDFEAQLYPCHISPKIYVVISSPDQEPTFIKFRYVTGARFNPPVYSMWLGRRGWEKDPSTDKLKKGSPNGLEWSSSKHWRLSIPNLCEPWHY